MDEIPANKVIDIKSNQWKNIISHGKEQRAINNKN